MYRVFKTIVHSETIKFIQSYRKVLNMAAEGHANIKVNGSVRLVGDVPTSRGAARTTTSVPPEMSTTFIETTTTLSTTTTRKQRSPPTIQVGDWGNKEIERIRFVRDWGFVWWEEELSWREGMERCVSER